MNLPDELMHDITVFLSKVDELRHLDRKNLLVAMLIKHFILTESEIVLSKKDLNAIIGSAKNDISSQALPTSIGKEPLDYKEAINVLLIEGVIGVLNSKGALKRLPKFDRR